MTEQKISEKACMFPCDNCRYRQESLDPEGCFKQASTTSWFSRFLRWVFGCKEFDSK